uniref:Peptidase A2 domain-containing protein n=1 Tax=Romanomermis culicivorax TaxID=13658 RepID=A0A915JBH7_ROMCU
MVIPSKEIASTAPIMSPGIVCLNATSHAFRDSSHIRSSICQIDNLTPSSKTFVRKYASMRTFQIPIKLGAVKAHVLIHTGAECSVLSSGLVKRALDKQSLQLPICGKTEVADGAVVNAHGPVVVTMESTFGEHMIKCIILEDDRNDQCIIGRDFLAHPDIHTILNFKENYIEIQDVKLPLKVIASVCSQTQLFLNATNDNDLEEIPEEERVIFYEDKSDIFSQPEEIEAEQPIQQAQPSPTQLLPQRLEVTELAEPIFLLAQVSVSISPHCQQWVNSTVFPTTTATIPDMIVQPLSTNSVAVELPIETAIINVTNSHCPLLFVNNTSNSIKLRPNQLIPVAKHTLGQAESSVDCQVATAAVDRDLTDREPAALDKLFSCHTDQQKLELALNKMTEKTHVTTAQKPKALRMLRQNRDVFSLPGEKPTFTNELTVSIDTSTAKPDYNYKVEYVKGKDNACADFLPEKMKARSHQSRALKIYPPEFSEKIFALLVHFRTLT